MEVLYRAQATASGGGREDGRSTTDDGKIDPSETRQDTAGTQAYRAPEMNGEAYDPAKVDVWALGIILFSLCAGFFPLREANPDVDWRVRAARASPPPASGANPPAPHFS